MRDRAKRRRNNIRKPVVVHIPDGKICDYIDETFRNDTPEEYVRQNIEKRLVQELHYPKAQIAVEHTIRIGANRRRVDLALFVDDDSSRNQEQIKTIIECKKEATQPNATKDGIDQLQSYMAACVNCEWGMWTNGKEKHVFRKVIKDGKHHFADSNDIPSADGSTDDIERPTRRGLRSAVEDNLLFTFKICHNHIYVNDGLQKQPAFFELLKLIFCKIEDERNVPKPLQFYAASSERANADGRLSVANRITAIFDRVKRKYAGIFDASDTIKLDNRSLANITSELQKYSLLDTNIDIKGKAYEEIVGANLRGDRGEFFTPRNVTRMVVDILAPSPEDRVLDPACGTGGFLVTAMTKVIESLTVDMERDLGRPRDAWESRERRLLQDRVTEIAESSYFGFDLNPDLVKAAKMNMVMNNDGSGHVFATNSLLHPHSWNGEFRTDLSRALNLKVSQLRSPQVIGLFDIIVTNPPFGSKIPIQDRDILEQFDLGHMWEYHDEVGWYQTEKLRRSVPPEQLFIERCLQFLKPGGRLGIVLPDSILNSPGLAFIRAWLVQTTRIVASIDLHVDTFQPRNGTQTSVLIVRKEVESELRREKDSGTIADYSIFMALVERVGHDKRGNPLFKRDRDGYEILQHDQTDVLTLGETASGTRTVRHESKTKVLDDQCPQVSVAFDQWCLQEEFQW